MKIDPLSDVVVIRRSSQQEISDGGIYIPPSDDFREDIGTIAFAGKGKRVKCPHCGMDAVRDMEVKAGQKVIFSTNGHQITQLNGEEFVVLREPSIIGVIE
jgi:chaperonin GroES